MILPDDFMRSVRELCVAARTTGGVAGPDAGLQAATARVEAMLEAIADTDWQAQARGEYRLPVSTPEERK